MKNVLVLALNPCIDAEWRVDGLRLHEKNLVLQERRWAGGKGVNVARWLRHLRCRPRLLLPFGGSTGREFRQHLGKERLTARNVPISAPTRVNVLATAPDGDQFRFNGIGPTLSQQEWRQCERAFQEECHRASWLVLSGSLPGNLPRSTYARLIRAARRVGLPTFLDCDGGALAAAIRARPFLVKPNQQELAQWCRHALRNDRTVVEAALAMARITGGWVLVSRGARGAMLVNHKLSFVARRRAPRVRAVNTLGAGDAMLAGAVAAVVRGETPDQWLDAGLAAGAAAVQGPPGQLPGGRLRTQLPP